MARQSTRSPWIIWGRGVWSTPYLSVLNVPGQLGAKIQLIQVDDARLFWRRDIRIFLEQSRTHFYHRFTVALLPRLNIIPTIRNTKRPLQCLRPSKAVWWAWLLWRFKKARGRKKLARANGPRNKQSMRLARNCTRIWAQIKDWNIPLVTLTSMLLLTTVPHRPFPIINSHISER